VFLGKSLALATELWVTGIILLGGSVVILHTSLHGAILALPSVVVTLAALAVAGTLYGALTSGGYGAATLLPVLALPAFAPLLIAGERSFSAALNHGGIWRWWLILSVALSVYTAIGILLYGVLEES